MMPDKGLMIALKLGEHGDDHEQPVKESSSEGEADPQGLASQIGSQLEELSNLVQNQKVKGELMEVKTHLEEVMTHIEKEANMPEAETDKEPAGRQPKTSPAVG